MRVRLNELTRGEEEFSSLCRGVLARGLIKPAPLRTVSPTASAAHAPPQAALIVYTLHPSPSQIHIGPQLSCSPLPPQSSRRRLPPSASCREPLTSNQFHRSSLPRGQSDGRLEFVKRCQGCVRAPRSPPAPNRVLAEGRKSEGDRLHISRNREGR